MTNVGAPIVVPTKAATISLPPGILGILGIKPVTISFGDGITTNIEMINEIPIIVTKNIRTFSKNEYLPTKSREYMIRMTIIAMLRTLQYSGRLRPGMNMCSIS